MIIAFFLLQQFEMGNRWIRTRIDYHPCITSELPFREHYEILPDNFQNSKTQLLIANYDEIIKTYQKENIFEKIETV